MIVTGVFLLALAVVAWTFVAYPALAVALARQEKGQSGGRRSLPRVTVVIAARNEAARIGPRIDNLLASDYPAERLRIVIVDDGSRDATADAANACADARVRVLRLPHAVGKAAALNRAMESVDTPVTVFADARQSFRPDALRLLVDALDQPGIGAAAGRLTLGPGEVNGLYWRVETVLRRAESRLGWSHSASGAIYAIRTDCFRPMPPGLILDDVWSPLQVARAGLRIVFVDDAVAIEPETMAPRAEFRRKLRTLSGNWQLIARAPWLLLPGCNPVFFAWFSHKFMRLVAPWALIAALAAAAVEVARDGSAWLQGAFWLQALGWSVAAAALLAPTLARRVPLAPVAASFLLLNLAALFALPASLGLRRTRLSWRP